MNTVGDGQVSPNAHTEFERFEPTERTLESLKLQPKFALSNGRAASKRLHLKMVKMVNRD